MYEEYESEMEVKRERERERERAFEQRERGMRQLEMSLKWKWDAVEKALAEIQKKETKLDSIFSEYQAKEAAIEVCSSHSASCAASCPSHVSSRIMRCTVFFFQLPSRITRCTMPFFPGIFGCCCFVHPAIFGDDQAFLNLFCLISDTRKPGYRTGSYTPCEGGKDC